MTSRPSTRWITGIAVVAPLAFAAALIPLRDRLDNTNVALLLVVVVVAVASTGRRFAAAIAALSAATAFNFFHTEPYYSLRVESGDDLETALLLLVVGIAVGELAARGNRARTAAQRGREDLKTLHGLGALVATGEGADRVRTATEVELTNLLGLVSCHFEATHRDNQVLPVIGRDGSVSWGPTAWETARWGLPTDGATIPVLARGAQVGRFILAAPVGVSYSADQLAQAVALVDQAGAALAAQPAVT